MHSSPPATCLTAVLQSSLCSQSQLSAHFFTPLSAFLPLSPNTLPSPSVTILSEGSFFTLLSAFFLLPTHLLVRVVLYSLPSARSLQHLIFALSHRYEGSSLPFFSAFFPLLPTPYICLQPQLWVRAGLYSLPFSSCLQNLFVTPTRNLESRGHRQPFISYPAAAATPKQLTFPRRRGRMRGAFLGRWMLETTLTSR